MTLKIKIDNSHFLHYQQKLFNLFKELKEVEPNFPLFSAVNFEKEEINYEILVQNLTKKYSEINLEFFQEIFEILKPRINIGKMQQKQRTEEKKQQQIIEELKKQRINKN